MTDEKLRISHQPQAGGPYPGKYLSHSLGAPGPDSGTWETTKLAVRSLSIPTPQFFSYPSSQLLQHQPLAT
jgi:hypothetical protein